MAYVTLAPPLRRAQGACKGTITPAERLTGWLAPLPRLLRCLKMPKDNRAVLSMLGFGDCRAVPPLQALLPCFGV